MQGTNKRRSLAVAWLIALAGIAGVAHAAGFDEKLKAPEIQNASKFLTEAKAFGKKLGEIRETTPLRLVTDASIARQRLDLGWQIQHRINVRQPIEGMADIGFVPLEGGSYDVDLMAHPEWVDLPLAITGVLNAEIVDRWIPWLVQRGFRAEDVAILKDYCATHDADAASRAAVLPIMLEFGRAVRKLDQRGAPVPDSLVHSYWYQSSLASGASHRAWIEQLLKRLDAQRGRILLSSFLEVQARATWIPDDVAGGLADTLAQVRRVDFEERATAAAKGVAP